MEEILALEESYYLRNKIQAIRDEITSAIRNAILIHNFDADVQLSFGKIHINPQGSVSQISFDGADITDIDRFIVEKALSIKSENYHDIRGIIKKKPGKFHFYPIYVNGKNYFTVLKSSAYFEDEFGSIIHNSNVKIEYAAKYMIISYSDNRYKSEFTHVYCIGLYEPKNTANLLIKNAGSQLGNKTLYYCFSNTRPEEFLHLGLTKQEFRAYHPEKCPDMYNFYKGSAVVGLYRINKVVDSNSKVKVKETQKKVLKHIIEMQYSTIHQFCKVYSINEQTLQSYFMSFEPILTYLNGDILTITRLHEILNIPFDVNEENLKDKNLLIPIKYEDIPDGQALC